MPSTTKYTAKVIISKVTHTQEQHREEKREVGEVADFTVRGTDLEKLCSNVQSHLELVDDE